MHGQRTCSASGARGEGRESSTGDTTDHSLLTTDQARDIDILFVGNLHPAVQRERLPWLARLARLGERWNVQIHQGSFGDEYKQLLQRARVVFNRGNPR